MRPFRNERSVPSQADLVVVGGGGSGLAAALTAAQSGATVIVLEKNASLGGTTALSVGSFSAAQTAIQRAAGIVDSEESFRNDLIIANGELEERENQSLRDAFIRNAADCLEWLQSLGLQFFGPTEEPPFTRPRMHNIVPNARAYIATLRRAARRAGVTIRTGFHVQRLLQESGGGVVGVEGPSRIHAKLGVILATGDYSANAQLKEEWISPQSARLPALNPSSTGDGFLMALKVGAVVTNADRATEDLRFPPPTRRGVDPTRWFPGSPLLGRALRIAIERLPRRALSRVARGALTAYVAPSQALLQAGAILVNHRGYRLSDDDTEPATALADEAKNACYVVFDARVAREFSKWPHPLSTFPGVAYAYLPDYERFRPDVTKRSLSIPELARAIGADPKILSETTSCYNRSVGDGGHKTLPHPTQPKGIVKAPFYALGPLSAFVTLTDGGLAVDTKCRVLDTYGRPICGLFAVGSTGQGGLILRNHGLHIAWAFTSGRIAARAALSAASRVDGA